MASGSSLINCLSQRPFTRNSEHHFRHQTTLGHITILRFEDNAPFKLLVMTLFLSTPGDFFIFTLLHSN